MPISGRPVKKKPRNKVSNRMSQRRFREKTKEREEATSLLIDKKFEELLIAEEENDKLLMEHRMLLGRLYIKEAIFQGQCQAANITLAPLTEPPPSNKTSICSIVKDLAVLLAIPHCPPSTAPPPPPAVELPSTSEGADRGTVSVNTPHGSQVENSNNTINETSSASALPEQATATAAASSGVDTESMVYLGPSSAVANMDYAPGNIIIQNTTTTTATAINLANGGTADIVAVVQSIQTAEHFLHYHSNLIEALTPLSIRCMSNGNAANYTTTGGEIQHYNGHSKLFRLHSAMSNLYSIYWHTAQLKPKASVDAAYSRLPQNTEVAVEIASQLMQHFDSKQLAVFRKASRDYERQMSRVSVSVESWLERIKACAIPEEPVPFKEAARVSLELVKCVSNLNAAVADGIKARRQMLENLKSKLKLEHMAFINLRSYPYMPDHVAVYTLLQETAREMHRNNINSTNK